MRLHLFALLALPVFASAQVDCPLKKSTDPFSHETKLSTGFMKMEVGNYKLSLSIDASPTEIDYFFWITNDSKCFDDASAAVFNYDGERVKGNFKNTGSMNCEGAFHVSFRNVTTTPSALQKLTLKKISSIKLTGNNNTVTELVFTEEQKEKIRKMSECVVAQGTTLIKQ
jgi:hypothetical protein